jgi:hypothetical protein
LVRDEQQRQDDYEQKRKAEELTREVKQQVLDEVQNKTNNDATSGDEGGSGGGSRATAAAAAAAAAEVEAAVAKAVAEADARALEASEIASAMAAEALQGAEEEAEACAQEAVLATQEVEALKLHVADLTARTLAAEAALNAEQAIAAAMFGGTASPQPQPQPLPNTTTTADAATAPAAASSAASEGDPFAGRKDDGNDDDDESTPQVASPPRRRVAPPPPGGGGAVIAGEENLSTPTSSPRSVGRNKLPLGLAAPPGSPSAFLAAFSPSPVNSAKSYSFAGDHGNNSSQNLSPRRPGKMGGFGVEHERGGEQEGEQGAEQENNRNSSNKIDPAAAAAAAAAAGRSALSSRGKRGGGTLSSSSGRQSKPGHSSTSSSSSRGETGGGRRAAATTTTGIATRELKTRLLGLETLCSKQAAHITSLKGQRDWLWPLLNFPIVFWMAQVSSEFGTFLAVGRVCVTRVAVFVITTQDSNNSFEYKYPPFFVLPHAQSSSDLCVSLSFLFLFGLSSSFFYPGVLSHRLFFSRCSSLGFPRSNSSAARLAPRKVHRGNNLVPFKFIGCSRGKCTCQRRSRRTTGPFLFIFIVVVSFERRGWVPPQ